MFSFYWSCFYQRFYLQRPMSFSEEKCLLRELRERAVASGSERERRANERNERGERIASGTSEVSVSFEKI